MTRRDILVIPNTKLRVVSAPVTAFDAQLKALTEDMFETMYHAPGIGLAAIQIGVAQRVITLDVSKKDEPPEPLVVANPSILWASEEKGVYEEGCLSIPEYYAEVERPAKVRVRFQDITGAERELEADGLLATCLQHEIDHLNGVLFIDHISRLKRERVVKKFTKAAKREGE